jgi:amidase
VTALHDLTTVEQLAALADRGVSSRELTEHYLQRIDAHGKQLGAFTTVFAEQAFASASAADASTGSRGPLHGLPLVLKDLHPTAGLRTTMGSAALDAWVPAEDAPVVGALRRAGAIVLAKTNAAEFGPVCYTETAVGGDATTPYGEGFSASGSSGGSAAAVAAGLAPIGHASDGLGSIRTPAATCGLVGIKASRGRVRASGMDWMALGVEGSVARTVADAALLLDVIGPTAGHELWRGESWPVGAHARAAARTPRGGLRIGRIRDPRIDAELHPDCLQAWELASDCLDELGHEVVDVPTQALPDLGSLVPAILAVIQARITAGVSLMVPESRRPLLMPFTRWLLAESAGLTALDLVRAQTQLAAAATSWLAVQSSYDVLLTPTTTSPPPRIGALRLDDARASAEEMLRWSAYTPWANFTGSPAASLPVHRTAEGLPIGVQITAAPGQDELVLSLASAMEQVFAWQHVHPAMWQDSSPT